MEGKQTKERDKEREMKTKYLLRIEEKKRGQVQEIGHCKSQACYTWLASGVPYRKQYMYRTFTDNVRNWESGFMIIPPIIATAF